MYYSAFRRLAGNEVISRLQEACDRTQAEGHSNSGIQSEMIFRFGSGDIEPRVVQPSSRHDVALCARSRECVDEIAKYAGDSKTVGVGRRRSKVLVGEIVVDPVKSNTDRQLGDTERESDDPVEAGSLSVAQLPDRYGRTSPDPKRVGLLTIRLSGKHDRSESRDRYDVTKTLHFIRRKFIVSEGANSHNITRRRACNGRKRVIP